MPLDIINLDKVRRGILYTLIMLGVFAVQSVVFSRVSLFGVKPFIVPVFPVAVGMLQGGMWGAGFGLITGMLCDSMLSDSTVMFTIMLPFFGFAATAAERYLIGRRAPACAAAFLAALLAAALCQALHTFLFYDAAPLALLRVAAFQTVFSLPFSYFVYLPCRVLSEKTLD